MRRPIIEEMRQHLLGLGLVRPDDLVLAVGPSGSAPHANMLVRLAPRGATGSGPGGDPGGDPGGE